MPYVVSKYFLPFHWFFSSLFFFSFVMQKLLGLMQSFTLCLCCLCFGDYIQKTIANMSVKKVFCCVVFHVTCEMRDPVSVLHVHLQISRRVWEGWLFPLCVLELLKIS